MSYQTLIRGENYKIQNSKILNSLAISVYREDKETIDKIWMDIVGEIFKNKSISDVTVYYVNTKSSYIIHLIPRLLNLREQKGINSFKIEFCSIEEAGENNVRF